MLNPDSVLLMLLLPSVKHLILAIRMSLQHAVLHFSRSHLVICRLAKCESHLEKPFCNASSEMPEGTGGCGQRGFYWERLCAFLLLLQTFHCLAITFVYEYIYRRTGRGMSVCFSSPLANISLPGHYIWTLCALASPCFKNLHLSRVG